jgi:hypothetical protein
MAGIDVHKKMLAVVVSDVEVDGEYRFERRMFGSSPEQLRALAAWLVEQEAEEAVMESTAQYWKPVWEALERYLKPSSRPIRLIADLLDPMYNLAVLLFRNGDVGHCRCRCGAMPVLFSS